MNTRRPPIGQLQDLLSRRRYLLALAVVVLIGLAAAAVVMAAVSRDSDSGPVLTASDGTALVVGGNANGFASEIECNSINMCRPLASPSTPTAANFERYLLVGRVKPGSRNAGAFGFRIGPGGSQLVSLACVKDLNQAYTCDPTGKTVSSRDTAVYVHE